MMSTPIEEIEERSSKLRPFLSQWHVGPGQDPRAIGLIEAACPSCGCALPSFPARKTKCPDCAATILVRTRPVDGRRVLVSENQDRQLAGQRELVSGATIRCNVTADDVSEFFEPLQEKFGSAPSSRDMIWACLGKQSIENVVSGSFGLYRNNQLDRAALLDAEGRRRSALSYLFSVIYLDANGASNGSRKDPSTLFNEETAFLAPQVMKACTRLLFIEGISRDDARQIFSETAERERRSTDAPILPREVWAQVEPLLFGPIDALA